MYMFDECIHGVFDVGRIGIAMADHVDRNGPEVLCVTPEIPRERFGMATGTVKKNDCIAAAGLNHARAYALDVAEALFKGHAAEICPNAHLLYPLVFSVFHTLAHR